jgi:hypothetical protein
MRTSKINRSRPRPAAQKRIAALIAQLAEHALGKGEVISSNLIEGSSDNDRSPSKGPVIAETKPRRMAVGRPAEIRED